MCVVTISVWRLSLCCEDAMPHTINCPNCDAPIHFKANQASAVCEYCHHQVRHTVMAQPKPTPPRPATPRPDPRLVQAQMQQAAKRTKKTILIIVGVTLDTMRQVESHLLMRHYDGFLKKGRLRSRR